MPQELPGFYYDAEKNRYFPLKGPIPGSSSSSKIAQKPPLKPTQGINFCRKNRVRTSKLLHGRELNGNLIDFNKGKCNFMEEVLKKQASQPTVWKYQGAEMTFDGALDHMLVHVQTPEGQTEVEVLVTGGSNGSLSFAEIGKVEPNLHNGMEYIPDRVRSVIQETKAEFSKSPGRIWRHARASLRMPSSISCINLPGPRSHAIESGLSIQHGLMTTLGSVNCGAAVYVVRIGEFLDYSTISMRQMIHKISSFECTIWTADYNYSSSEAVIGTNLGAALVNLETGSSTWICRSKSDVLAQRFDQSGNVVLCGLRNGAIVTVDVREKQDGYSGRLIRHKIPYSSFGRSYQSSHKQWFEIKGKLDHSCSLFMPSSVCCLVSLKSYEQYFLASSMDGSIKLYDHRMAKRGAIQSYEGHVNSHTHLQLGVDQSERFLIAGGEDCNLRLWSIKSGELLFDEKVSDAALSAICLQKPKRYTGAPGENNSYEESPSEMGNWGAWCGSQKGLFYVHFP